MPDWTEEVRKRLSPLRLSPARETEIVDELSQHLDDRWRELIAGGASSEEATKLTLDDFSDGDGLARYMAPLRQAHPPSSITAGASSGHMLGDFWQDLRYTLRVMAARPGFAAVAILSLALGIGANSAIFGLWNGLLHASLPAVEKPEQLVMLSNPDESGSWTGQVDGVRNWLTYEEFEQIRDHTEGFSGVMASQSSLNTWQVRVDDGPWEEASGRLVSGGFFEVLGVGAAIGRVFTTDQDRAAAPDAVISCTYWQRRFGGRPDAVGRTLTVRKTSFTIIGVASRGFIGETSGQQPDPGCRSECNRWSSPAAIDCAIPLRRNRCGFTYSDD
jgi:MacB-like periplasmic core domain